MPDSCPAGTGESGAGHETRVGSTMAQPACDLGQFSTPYLLLACNRWPKSRTGPGVGSPVCDNQVEPRDPGLLPSRKRRNLERWPQGAGTRLATTSTIVARLTPDRRIGARPVGGGIGGPCPGDRPAAARPHACSLLDGLDRGRHLLDDGWQLQY